MCSLDRPFGNSVYYLKLFFFSVILRSGMQKSLKEPLISFGDLFQFSLVLILSVIDPRKQQLVLEATTIQRPALSSTATVKSLENCVTQLDFSAGKFLSIREFPCGECSITEKLLNPYRCACWLFWYKLYVKITPVTGSSMLVQKQQTLQLVCMGGKIPSRAD